MSKYATWLEMLPTVKLKGLNTDGLFIMADSDSFLSLKEILLIVPENKYMYLGIFNSAVFEENDEVLS